MLNWFQPWQLCLHREPQSASFFICPRPALTLVGREIKAAHLNSNRSHHSLGEGYKNVFQWAPCHQGWWVCYCCGSSPCLKAPGANIGTEHNFPQGQGQWQCSGAQDWVALLVLLIIRVHRAENEICFCSFLRWKMMEILESWEYSVLVFIITDHLLWQHMNDQFYLPRPTEN